LYLSRLSEDGVLVMHVSNKFMRLDTVVARIADELGVPARRQSFTAPGAGDDVYRISSSEVIILARTPEALTQFDGDVRWQPVAGDGKRPWTDDYSNIVGAIWERQR
jgi:hypothetical protein